ncbi:MAG: NAD(P)-dependent oxidoreductase [Clostridia bacterium]|nr:NAD(P)-dependent oxidoreductase [Clostridia bacterium]
MKRAIVTGASGMLGSNLIRRLTENEVEVAALVRPKTKKLKNIPNNDLVKIYECDAGEMSAFEPQGKFDAVFNFAWMGTMGKERSNRALQEKNVKNTMSALYMAERAGAKVFVTCGSQAEYGTANVKLKEDTPLNPENEYAVAKALSSMLVRERCEKTGIAHVHARVVSVYGLGDNPGTMVETAVRQMLANEETQFTTGEQRWDYLNARDAARAFYLMAEEQKTKTYVVGSGECRPLAEYIKIIAEETGYEKEIGFGKIKPSPGTPRFLCAGITELKKLGFEPKIEFREGIREIIEAKMKA